MPDRTPPPPERPAPVARPLLLAEQLALVAMRPATRRRPVGTRAQLNACLAALLLAELQLDDRPPTDPVLDAAAEIARERGPRPRSVLSHMDRGLAQRTGLGTWELLTSRLDEERLAGRDELISRLQHAAASDDPLDVRTQLLLSFAGPAQLLEVVAPQRRGRRHARARIDRGLEGTVFEELRRVVRRLLSDDAAAAVVASTAAVSG